MTIEELRAAYEERVGKVLAEHLQISEDEIVKRLEKFLLEQQQAIVYAMLDLERDPFNRDTKTALRVRGSNNSMAQDMVRRIVSEKLSEWAQTHLPKMLDGLNLDRPFTAAMKKEIQSTYQYQRQRVAMEHVNRLAGEHGKAQALAILNETLGPKND